MSLTTQTDGDREGLSKAGRSRLTAKPARHSASCRVPFFIVEKSVVMVYNKLLNFSGVMGDWKSSDLRRICGEMRMTIAQVMQKMISFSEGNIHDIDHFIRVWTYAKTTGELEHLDRETQYILEVAAITHDMACPLCREKYGNTNGKYQEAEGIPMVKAFLCDTGISASQVERVQYLVGHHHTFSGIDGIDYQILIEADYIANASENGCDVKNIENFMNRIVKTSAGKQLIKSVFCL